MRRQRKRLIHQSVCTSEQLAGVSDAAGLLYMLLIASVDDYGCFTADPGAVNGLCWPLKGKTAAATRKALTELSRATDEQGEPLICLYTAGRAKLLHLPRFRQRQVNWIRGDRHSRSEYPRPNGCGCPSEGPKTKPGWIEQQRTDVEVRYPR